MVAFGSLYVGGRADAGSFFRQTQFRRADANGDGDVNISDVLFTLNALFSNAPGGTCAEALDANDDGSIDISDGVYSLGFLFSGLPAPPPPGPFDCGVVSSGVNFGCDAYAMCPDDTALIHHVLSRITFGVNEDLLTRIQTRADLIVYIDAQLDAPENFDAAVHEPDLHARIEALEIGFRVPVARPPVERLKAMLIENSVHSQWQLLHVVTQFWNNHFHTQIDALRELFFSRGRRAGRSNRGNPAIFAAVDTDDSDTITETEWVAFRALHPTILPWGEFARQTRDDGVLTLDEFDQRNIAFWKYGGGNGQFAISADMEKREYEVLRRHGFGFFRDLLESSAKGVAMLIYLNGFENTSIAPNENYGREFFELSSLDVDRMYTQRDIEEMARVLTSWTVAWVERGQYDASDTNFANHPEADRFAIDLREGPPYNFPTGANWDDAVYTWAFVIGNRGPNGGHDWERKDLFLPRYGGTDSFGNPVPESAALTIPANAGNRTQAAVLEEFDLVLERVVGFRDVAKFIGSKLIQLFVTDDLSALAKTGPVPSDIQAGFDSVDTNTDGVIDLAEWETPIPLILPNGRPPEIFLKLDVDGDEMVVPMEYREPDLLYDVIETWQATGGDMREVVREILHSDEFLSLKFYRAKVTTPYENTVAAVRALEGEQTITHLVLTVRDLTLAGMDLFNFGDPTGESEFGFDWMHTIGLLERLKFLNRGAFPSTGQDVRLFYDPPATAAAWSLETAEDAVDFYAELFYGGDVLDAQRELAVAAFAAQGVRRQQIPAAVAYLLSLPQFQKQ